MRIFTEVVTVSSLHVLSIIIMLSIGSASMHEDHSCLHTIASSEGSRARGSAAVLHAVSKCAGRATLCLPTGRYTWDGYFVHGTVYHVAGVSASCHPQKGLRQHKTQQSMHEMHTCCTSHMQFPAGGRLTSP